ncbi:MAG: hypothetical protein NVS1B10_07720 [Candidatus Saccharimonadales bacterium]
MKLKELNNYGFTHTVIAALFVLIFVIAGTGYVVNTHAATKSNAKTSTFLIYPGKGQYIKVAITSKNKSAESCTEGGTKQFAKYDATQYYNLSTKKDKAGVAPWPIEVSCSLPTNGSGGYLFSFFKTKNIKQTAEQVPALGIKPGQCIWINYYGINPGPVTRKANGSCGSTNKSPSPKQGITGQNSALPKIDAHLSDPSQSYKLTATTQYNNQYKYEALGQLSYSATSPTDLKYNLIACSGNVKVTLKNAASPYKIFNAKLAYDKQKSACLFYGSTIIRPTAQFTQVTTSFSFKGNRFLNPVAETSPAVIPIK